MRRFAASLALALAACTFAVPTANAAGGSGQKPPDTTLIWPGAGR